MRPTWEQLWMKVALDVAERSLCSRAKVGAVITSQENRILAVSYNGSPAGWRYTMPGHPRDWLMPVGDCVDWCKRGREGPTAETVQSYTDCPATHAELTCLGFSDRSTREGGDLYVTGPICWTCAKAVANSGLKRVFVLGDDTRDYRKADESYKLLRDSGLRVVGMMLP